MASVRTLCAHVDIERCVFMYAYILSIYSYTNILIRVYTSTNILIYECVQEAG